MLSLLASVQAAGDVGLLWGFFLSPLFFSKTALK